MKLSFALFQRLFMIVLLVVVVGTLIGHRQDFILASHSLRHNTWPLVVLAVLSECAFQWNRAHRFRAIYRLFVDPAPSPFEVLATQLASIMANIALPAVGLAGLTLNERLLSKYKLKIGVLVFTNGLYAAIDYLFFFAYFALSLLILSLGLVQADPAVYSAGLVLLAVLLIVIGALVLFFTYLRQIHTVVHEIAEQQQPLLPLAKHLRRTVLGFFSSADEAWKHHDRLWGQLFWFGINEPLRLTTLALILISLGIHLSFPVLLIVYIISVLSMALSITPQGLGTTEAVMTALLFAFGVPTGLAAIAVLLYRLVTFWLPFSAGLVLLHRTNTVLKEANS